MGLLLSMAPLWCRGWSMGGRLVGKGRGGMICSMLGGR
jgi:hypothetical protein